MVNNVALDHKSMDELRTLFRDFTLKAKTAVLNLDNPVTAALAAALPPERRITYSLVDPSADLFASDAVEMPAAVAFNLRRAKTGGTARVRLPAPGRHNVSNALAAMAAALACGIGIEESTLALSSFRGIRRRLEVVGTAGGGTVSGDFAHNPDKIAATLDTLHAFDGRLLVMFQPHGYGPLKLMKDGFVEVFAERLAARDVLVMPEPVYYGGTTDRSISSADIVQAVAVRGREAQALPDRDACGERLLELARPGDRILVMGARDDTLSTFCEGLVARLGG